MLHDSCANIGMDDSLLYVSMLIDARNVLNSETIFEVLSPLFTFRYSRMRCNKAWRMGNQSKIRPGKNQNDVLFILNMLKVLTGFS